MFSRCARHASAYRATDYVAAPPGQRVVIRPGRRSRPADRALARHKARTAAFITAFNPFSRPRGTRANMAAHAALTRALRRLGLPFVEGHGQGDDQRWPAEKSVLVFRMNARIAAAVGRRFRQNAIVHVRLGRPAVLLALH